MNIEQRKTWEQRYNLIVSIGFEISLYQACLLNDESLETDVLWRQLLQLQQLRANVASLSLNQLQKLHHDLSVKIQGVYHA